MAAGLLGLAALFLGLTPLRSASTPELLGPYTVLRVVDGDTLDLQIEGEAVRVRLIGVDTPESVHPEEARNTPAGEIAAAWVKELLAESPTVYLEYDVGREDSYGRRLAYVYLSDGVTMVNRLLLREGLAQVMTVPPNVKYADEFARLQETARQAGMGFWGEG